MFICLSILGGDSVGLFMFKIRIKITIQSNPIHIFHWWKWRYPKKFRISPWSPINVNKKWSLGGASGVELFFLSAADLFKPCFWLSFSTFYFIFAKCEKIVSDKDILEFFLNTVERKVKPNYLRLQNRHALEFFLFPGLGSGFGLMMWVIWVRDDPNGLIIPGLGLNLTCDRLQQNRIEREITQID